MPESNFEILGNRTFEEMDLPPIIYKYRDWNNSYNKRILTQRELYLASPSSFEDEYDCKVPIRYDLLTDKDIFLYYFDSSRALHPHFSLSQHLEYAEAWRNKGLLRDRTYIEQIDNAFFYEFNRIFGVLSLTAVPDNISMWNYYANDETGFCVGFHTLPLFKLSQYFGGGGEVSYHDEFPIIRETDTHEKKYSLQIFSKLRKWEFEKEYRLTKFRVQNRKPKIPTEIFAEIILGAKIADKDKLEIINIASNNFPNCKLIQAINADDEITFEDV